jgi:predicted permease
MLENLIFSINAVLPMFAVIFAGWFFKKKKIINENFVSISNKLVFQVVLPIKLFLDVYNSDFSEAFDIKFISFAVVCSILSFFVIWKLSDLLINNKSQIGAFVQGSFRGNYALMGVALIDNVLGKSASKAVLIVAFVIPIYNVLSVIVLTMRSKTPNLAGIKKALVNIFKNPLIVGILLSLPFSIFSIKLPTVIFKSLNSFGTLAMPLALLAIGGSFDIAESISKMKISLIGSTIKLVILPLIFVPIAILLGFSGEDILVLYVMFATPTAVSSYTMARYMNNDEHLAANILVLSTLLSVFTFTIGIYLLKTLWII